MGGVSGRFWLREWRPISAWVSDAIATGAVRIGLGLCEMLWEEGRRREEGNKMCVTGLMGVFCVWRVYERYQVLVTKVWFGSGRDR